MAPVYQGNNLLLSFFSECWNFIKEIFYSIGRGISSIFHKHEENPIDNEVEVQKIPKPEDEIKKRRKESNTCEMNSYFKQKNINSNVAKKTNNLNNRPRAYGQPHHFDRNEEQKHISETDDSFNLNYNPDFVNRGIRSTHKNRSNEFQNSFQNNQKPVYIKDFRNDYDDNDNNNDNNHISQNNRNDDNNYYYHIGRNDHNDNDQSHRHHMPLSKDDKKRQEIGKETMQVINNGIYKTYNKKTKKTEIHNIKDKVEYCIYNTRTIKPDDNIGFDKSKSNSELCKIDVTTESSFEALRRVKTNRTNRIRETCILNFASATQPGGGFLNGRSAQEETLSRQSALYPSLKSETEMYDYHKANPNPYYTDYMVYSPNVPFFRNDDYQFIEPFTASVISSPAVNYSELMKNGQNGQKVQQKVYNVMKRRCERIIKLCISTGNKAIVLGAFGCGVFKNPPEMISQIFKEILIDEGYGYYLDYVVFPIYSKSGTGGNTYKIFKETLATK